MLSCKTEIKVRFNEADPLGIVWHGHYIRYFEDGREDFGNRHGLSYLDFYRNGLVVPIVDVSCKFKLPLKYGDRVIVETTFLPCLAAKLKFSYRIFKKDDHRLVATGYSEQVFVDRETFVLHLSNPSFFEKWKLLQKF
ncbi:MAG: acyl-CoA thioesterase [Crocinitomicaceae bacterium]|nr:acyl-CoA thioesterase [Crocinitomicaceae bacterium]